MKKSATMRGKFLFSRPSSHLIALEPRMMFDGAIVATTAEIIAPPLLDTLLPDVQDNLGRDRFDIESRLDIGGPLLEPMVGPAYRPFGAVDDGDAAHGGGDATDWRTLDVAMQVSENPLEPSALATNTLIFIDTAVAGYDQLVSEWQGEGTIILIDSSRDGVEQILAALAGRTDVDAIHIVSHGDEGSFNLGATRIDLPGVTGELADAFAAIGRHLSADGDIFLYGCDVGAGQAGQDLLDALAITTGADIAASIDDTGYIMRGGDWTLESRLGVIDNASLTADDWQGLLAPTGLAGVNGALTVRDGSGALVAFTAGQSAAVGAGSVARWTNVATVNGIQVDLVATVVSLTNATGVRFNQPGTNGTLNDDFGILLQSTAGTGNATAVVTWTLVRTGTTTPVQTDISFTVGDIDGISNTVRRESVAVSTDTLSSFQSAAPTRVRFDTGVAGQVTAFGTADEAGAAESGARFNWLNTSSFQITYLLNRANGVTTQALFSHDGNLGISLGTGGVTTSIPRLDLDGNDSTAAGSGYRNNFVENGAAISIVDTDVSVTNPAGNVTAATITLTNAQTGDVLSVGTLPTGLAATVNTSVAGVVTISITGSATAAQYQAAFQAITFRNTSERPSTVDRTITASFTNGTFSSNVATSTITVVDVNDTPTITAPTSFTGTEDTALTIGGIALGDVDSSSESVQLTISVPAGIGVVNFATTPFISVVNNGTGTITLQGQRTAIQNAVNGGALTLAPAANYNGTSTVTFVFNDRGNTGRDPGLTADATSEEARVTATLAIGPINDAPVAVGNLPPQTNVDAQTGISVATAAGFTDVDNTTLTYSAAGLPDGLTINTATGVITGTINPSASQGGAAGVYNVTVTAQDLAGLTATQMFSWTVTNPAPIAVNDPTLTVNEDTAGTTVNVLANDSDPDGDPLTITSASATNGTVSINANGTLLFTPNANYNGPATITYTISDGQGGTATATVPVTVVAVNDAPTRVGTLPPQTNVDAAMGINVATAQAFTDVDGPQAIYSADGLPLGLSINSATGVITGTIDRSASQPNGGIYNVVVTRSDGTLSVTQPFTWTVTNPGPVAVNDGPLTTNEDTPIASINVRGNDSDPDGDPISVVSASAPNGTVTINADGTLRYVPNANFNGTDTITYTISDGQGGTATATVAITVAAVNDAPTPVGTLPPQTNVDATTGINVPTAPGFTDLDNATLTYSATDLPAGLTIDGATGVITGTIDRSASQGGSAGVYSVTVTARDAAGATATQTFSWTVTNPAPVAVNDLATTAEDTPVTIAVLPNDSDPDGDPLPVIAAVASVGTATVVGNQVQYTPPANYNGTATITYTISDGQGGTATATITVTVTAVNDAPVATPIPPSNTTDGATLSIPVASNFSDVDGNTLSFSAADLPPGLTIDAVTGVISGTIAPNASQTNGGVYTATITVSDGNGGTVQQTITFNVSNPPPVAANDTAFTAEDTPVTVSPLANDNDPDGDPVTITTAAAQNGTVTINANGTVTYTPNPGFNGSDTITYTISDGNGGTSTATISVSVSDVNDVPVRNGSIGNQTNLDSQIINLPVAGAFSDPDGDTLSYSATGLPAGLTINTTTGVISGTIDNSASQVNGGAYAITVTASDGRGGTVTQTFGWTVTNPVPGAVNDVATTNEDTPVAIPVLANDVDPDGDPLTVTAASAGNGTVVILPGGTLQYTPNANFNGTDTILYTITDSEGGISTASVTVTVRPVNDTPTTVGLPNQNGDDGATVSFSVASAFGDPDGDPLTFTATNLPPNLTIDPATGLITGTLSPETSQNGPYVVTVTATDPSGAQVTTSFVYSVQNIPPVAVNDVAVTPEDVPVTVAVLANDSDPDRDPLTITSASANNGTVVVNANGTLTFTPNPNFNGVANISYTVSDGNGGIATATLTVTVGAVNDAPTALPIPDQASVDGAFYSAGVAPFFSDLDGDTLSFTATGLPAGLTIDSATGVVSGTIAAGASQVNGGVYSVTITASDGNGGTVSRTLTATVTNPAPTASNDSATTAEDTLIPAINVLGNDVDPDGDALTVTAASAPNGTVTINADGTLNYVPNANFNGTDVITYVISDGNGGTSTAAVTVTVTPVNDAPVAVDDNATTNEDQPVTIGILGNDSDVDGDGLTVTAATSPNGTVVINADGTITFTPNANFNGPTTITYTISDGNGGTATATVNVTVSPVNDAPVANPSTASTSEDTPVNVPVLANDSDVDGNPLTVTSATAPNGVVTINPDGTVTYTPNANFNGTDTITYTISDGQGGFSTSTVTVTVGVVNDAPTVTPIAPQTNNDAAVVNLPVAGNFADLDGDTLSFIATGLPTGLSIDPATGVISGTIDRSASQLAGGVYSVTVTASDGNGGTVSTTFTWTVENPGPTATNDTAITNEDTPVTVPVLSNDSDPDGDPLTVVNAAAPNGTVVINANGTITYTPNANFTGSDTITYTISDGQGGTSTAIVTVTVNSVNDAPVVDAPLPAQTGLDGAPVSFPVAGNFSDLDGDTLSFVATGLPPGLTMNAAGVVSGTLTPGASQGGPNGDGIYTVSVTASDGNGGTVTTTFTYTATNPAPTAANDSATTPEDTPVTIPVLANDNDPDGDPLTITSASSPDGVVVINADGTITFTPNANFNGPTTISYAISDGNGGTATATVNVTVGSVNDAPTVDAPLANANGVDGTAESIPTAGAFSDLDGDTLSFTASGLPTGLSINPTTGVISGTVDRNASQVNGGVYTITVTANDGNGGTVSSTFTYTVTNPPPVAANDVAATNEDAPVTIGVLANDTDPDGDPLTVTAATSPDGVVTINANGTLTFTPSANFNGPTTITYTISDGNGGTSTATVDVTVSPVNDAPTADPPLSPQTNRDADPITGATAINVAPNFADLDGDTLSFSATGLPPGLLISAAGVITGTIDPGASQGGVNGVYSVTVTAVDGNGGTISSTFSWTITNPAPVAANDSASTNEDTPVAIPVLLNDNDPDGDPLTVTAATAANGIVTIGAGGVLTYTPNANFNGTDTISYTISDGNGGTSTATVTVTVAPVNDAPQTVGLPDLFDSNNELVVVPVGPAFSDLDGNTLSFTATGLPQGLSIEPATGRIIGQISPTASAGGPGSNGIYTVTVTASDGNGGTVSTSFTWRINNTPPLAVDDGYGTAEDTPITMAVLSNDTDPDGDVTTPIQIVRADANNGTAVVNPNGTITFTPDPDFVGTATVTYTISDGLGGFSTAVATIVISPVNDAPDVTPLPDRANVDGAIVSAPAGSFFSDIDGGLLEFSATGLPGGLIIDQVTGVISGTINADASGINGGLYFVTVTADDGAGGVTSVTFQWSITNPAPVASDDLASTTEDLPALSIPVLNNDNDSDGDLLTVISASSPNGTVIIGSNGVLFYTPDANFNGTDTITYVISDGQGGTSTAIVTVTVGAANDAPTATPLPARSNVDSTAITGPTAVDVSGNFADLDGDTLSFIASGLPLGLTMDSAGLITGTIVPNASQGAPNGIYTVTVTASDGNGGSVVQTFSWTVTNPPPVAVNDTASTSEDTPVDIPVLTGPGVDVDPDGDPLTVTTASAGNGSVTIGAGGVLTYTPNADFTGTDTITYTISDGNGGTSTATVTVTVTASDGNGGSVVQTFSWTVTNPPPVAVNDTASTTEDTPVDISVLTGPGADSDPDNDPLTVTTASAGNGTVTIGAGGVLTYTPNADFNGTDTITYTISDGNGGTATAIVNVTVGAINDAPVSTALAPQTNVDGATISVPVAANFSDVDNATLEYSATGLPLGLSIDRVTGVISGTVDRGASQPAGGIYSVTVTATDAGGLTSSQTFSWTITNPPPVAVNDVAATPEDTLVNINVRGNDGDPDGDTLTITTAGAGNGTVVIRPDGTIDYTPNANFNGVDTITYTISDGNGGTSTATVTVTVAPRNDPPVAVNDASSTDEDTPVTVPLLANDSDLDGDPLTVTAASSPNGTVVINPDGSVVFTPNPNFNGEATITYSISDGQGGVDTATAIVIVRPVNDAPVAVNDSGATPEDTPVTLNPLGNDNDVDGDPLTISSATSPNGQVTINPDGTITFTPDPNFSGTTTVTYIISDGNGGTSTATVALTVTEVNDPPVAVNDNVSTREDFPVTIPVLLNDTDADNDPLRVTQAVAGNGTVTVNPDGTITYAPNPDFNGVDIITYTITDGRGGFSTATVTIGVGTDNDAPVSTPIANQANVDNAPVSLPVASNFSDVDGDTLSFAATGLPAGLTIDRVTGIISGTIDREASQVAGGIYNVSVIVSDGQGGQTTRSFGWTVTNPPPLAANDTAATPEDTPVTIMPLGNDRDPDGDPLSITTAGAPNGTVTINPDGTLLYTPRADFNGTDTITYVISDGNGGTSTATITVTVAPVNDPPVAVNDNASTAEDAPVIISVLPNDRDRDGDPLTVTNAIAANGIVTINPDGTIVYTPNLNFNGVDTITYSISDGNGGTSVATVTVGVGLVNDPPVATALANLANVDLAPISLSVASAYSDPDGNPLEFTAIGLPAGLSIGPDGVISGTIDPAASQINGGIYTVTVTASDGLGGAVSRTFTWTVTNPAPVAANDAATTPEDTPVTISVLSNDNDPDGDPLAITAATSPNGTVTINADGTLSFAPNANFNGVATISYTISDGNGGTAIATATVTVTPVNDPPVASNDSATTNEDTPVRVAVLPNDIDLDGDPLTVVSASAGNGTVTINPDGTITYVPNPNFNGVDAITYTISDGGGGISTATVQITVNAVNDVPVAVNDSATTPEDQPVTIPVLANDSDADGNPLTITAATSPNGTVTINPDGTITFVPNANFNGPATITYTISDGQGGTTTATVAVNVTPINDPPVARNDSVTVVEDTPIRVSPLANDSDVDVNPLTIVSASSPNGTVTINPDGTISFVPDPNFNGPTTITYQISDGQGGFATATISVNVTPVNDPPVARNDALTMDEDTTARIPVLSNDTDADGDPLTITAASSPNGTVAINADGTISFTPTPDFFGTATITYTITDGNGGTSTATVTVNVRNINELPVDGDERLTTIGGVDNVIAVLANATDPDGNPISIFSASVDVGTVIVNADGTLSYVAPFGYSGPATIVYIVSDGQGGFDRSVVIIDVIEAAADINALLGTNNLGIPDGWRVDRIRDQSAEFIDVPLIIDQTANDFRSLNPTPMLFGHRPLLTAINGISWLGGTPEHNADGHPILETTHYIDRVRDLRFGHDRLFDPRWGDFMVKTLTGFSVRQLDTGHDQIMIDSVVRDRVIYMEIKDIGKDSDPRIVEYQLRSRNGAPLPDWIRMDSRGLAIIERPVDAQEIRLIVRAIRADGQVIDIPVVVQGATGEIQLDDALAGKKISAAEPLSQKLAAASAAATNEAARLVAAFSSKA